MAQKSVHEIAQSFDLFGEYVDPDATVTREQFDTMCCGTTATKAKPSWRAIYTC